MRKNHPFLHDAAQVIAGQQLFPPDSRERLDIYGEIASVIHPPKRQRGAQPRSDQLSLFA